MSVSSDDDIIDVRDVINDFETAEDGSDERNVLESILDDLRGMGGDHEWKGDWYPVTLVRDTYFVEYAQELAEEIGAINDSARWPNDCIDWDKAASELQNDYNSVEFEGMTYWYR